MLQYTIPKLGLKGLGHNTSTCCVLCDSQFIEIHYTGGEQVWVGKESRNTMLLVSCIPGVLRVAGLFKTELGEASRDW